MALFEDGSVQSAENPESQAREPTGFSRIAAAGRRALRQVLSAVAARGQTTKHGNQGTDFIYEIPQPVLMSEKDTRAAIDRTDSTIAQLEKQCNDKKTSDEDKISLEKSIVAFKDQLARFDEILGKIIKIDVEKNALKAAQRAGDYSEINRLDESIAFKTADLIACQQSK